MSAVTKARYRDATLKSFRGVLTRWLTKLPPAGWEGRVSDLEAELWDIARSDPVPAFVPRGTGLGRRIAAERPFIETSGVTVEYHRTKYTRTMRFIRVPSPGER